MTVKLAYTTPATLTWGMTNPTSDANRLVGRQSTAVSNATNLFMNVLIGGVFTGPSSSAGAGRIDVYAYGTWDAATYPGQGSTDTTNIITGSDGAKTLTANGLLRLVPVTFITTVATNSALYHWGPFSLHDLFGDVPELWGLWGAHNAGAALAGSTTKYTGIHYADV